MLSTGIKSPIGIKVSGTVLADIDATAEQIEEVARTVPGVASALAERLEGGRYLSVDIQREKAARYGMTVGDVQLFITSAVGGAMVGETVEGIARYPINLRYPQSYRDRSGSVTAIAGPDAHEATNHAGGCGGLEGCFRPVDVENRERTPDQLDLHRCPRS